MEFSCNTCGASFTTEKSLQRHIRAQHLEIKHLCRYCQKAYHYIGDKTKHEKNCAGNKQQVDTVHECQQCHKTFKGKCYLDMHTQAQHMGIKHPCEKCGKYFKYSWNCKKHSQTCGKQKKTYNCSQCPKVLSSLSGLNNHEKSHKKVSSEQTSTRKRKNETTSTVNPTKPKQRRVGVLCTQCHQTFSNRHEHYLHRMRQHFQTGSGATLQQPPWGNKSPPFEDNQSLSEVYEANRPLILSNHQEGNVQSIYKVPMSNDFTVDHIMTQANDIYDRQNSAFRLNLEFGLILLNTETGEYRYFVPYSNEALFERPIYISRRRDLQRLRLRLQRLNITDFMLRQRPNTKWKPVLVTNARLIVYHLDYPLGVVHVELPDYIKNSKAIIALDKTFKGKYYKDHLCAFRCLATHQGHHRDRLETHSKVLFKKWIEYIQNKCPNVSISLDPKAFKGVELSQLAYFEKCFQINVNVYRLQEDQSAIPVYKSQCHFQDTIHLNLFDKHLSYISNLTAYTQKYQCPSCQMHFKFVHNMKRHRRTCLGKTKHQFPGGFYSSPKSIFDKLEEQGIVVPTKDRIFPWFLVFDFEAMLLSVQEQNSDKLTWTAEHAPISVSICSNVEGFKSSHCIVDSNTNSLVASMVQHMTKVGDKSYELAKAKFGEAFEKLDRVIGSELPLTKDPVDDESFLEKLVSDSKEWQKQEEMHMKQCKKLKDDLDSYCRQIPCISFNGSKYDLNLIKKYLAVHLKMHASKTIFTVKRNNQYACLSNENFKFLDITQYLAPGVNYASFLKAFDVKNQKVFSPTNGLPLLTNLTIPNCLHLVPLGFLH